MYPQLPELRAVEKNTLKAILQISEFARLDGMHKTAAAAIKTFNECAGGIDVHLHFHANIRLRQDSANKLLMRRVDVGALVELDPAKKSDISNASYSVLICKSINQQRNGPVRKMHFDYEPIGKRVEGEPKPSVHMQICGKFSPKHYEAGVRDAQLEAWFPRFEKPRIPTPPTSLALVLNWLFMEFQSDTNARAILRNGQWKNMVIEAERKVLTPYFQSGLDYLTGGTYSRKRFCQGFQYQERD